MIANCLPSDATHSSFDFLQKPSLLVAFDDSLCQKLGPVYSPTFCAAFNTSFQFANSKEDRVRALETR